MSNGDRGIIFALIGWLAFTSFISWDAAKEQKPEIYCPKGGQPSDCRPQQYATERAFIPSGFERAISNPEPSTGQEHEKRDLAAQEASAAFGFWMALFAGVGTAVTSLGTFLLYQQIKLTREAVEDTGLATLAMQRQNDIAERAQRPYLHIEEMGWQKVANRSVVVFILEIKNFGQTPARDFSVNADVRYSIDGKPPMLWTLMPISMSDIIPQGKIIHALVNCSDPRLGDVNNRLYLENCFCRLELRYCDSFGNAYALFETYSAVRSKQNDGKFRFFSTP